MRKRSTPVIQAVTRAFASFQTLLAALTSSALPEATPPAPAPAGGAAPPAAEARADELPAASGEDAEDPPEGYYAFVESPNATPPR